MAYCTPSSFAARPRSVATWIAVPDAAMRPSRSTPAAPALSEVPDQRARPVAGRTQQRTAASQLRTCRLRLAARALLAGSTEQEGRLRSLVPYQRRDSAGGRCRPQTSRSGNRLSECAPHLGPEFATSSAHSLCDPGWWSVARPPALDPSALPVLLAREDTEPCLSRQICRRLEARLSARRTRVPRQPSGSGQRERLSCFPPPPLSSRLGGLCQTPVRRAGARASVPGALHSPRGHLQSSDSGCCRRQGHLPLERLCPRRQATQDDRHRRRVSASIHAACPTTRVRPDSLFWLPGEPAPQTTSAPRSAVPTGQSAATFRDAWK